MSTSKENKKAVQLKLASMSANYTGQVKRRSGKNESQLMQYIKKKARQNQKNKQ